MNKKYIFLVVGIVVIISLSIAKLYILDSAKNKYCIEQSRTVNPSGTGAPSQKQLEFYDQCFDDMNIIEAIKLTLSEN